MAQPTGLYDSFWHVESIKNKEGQELANLPLKTRQRMGFSIAMATQALSIKTPANWGSGWCRVDFQDETKGRVSDASWSITEIAPSYPDDINGESLMGHFPNEFDF